MPSISQVLSAATFAGLAVAAPASPQHKFSVPQVATNKGFKVSGPQAIINTHAKYGKVAPSHVYAAAAAQGSVVATPSDQYDSSYLCPVTVGSGSTAKTLNLDFDTGSSDLWVFSTLLPKSQQGSHNLYSPTASKKLSGYTWNISYGDGSGAKGTVYRDSVTIGGITYSSQAVEAATSVSSEFVSDTNDGLVGLAFSSINTVSPTQQKTFLDNVSPSLASPIVAANLKYHAKGEYDFGFIDSSKYTGSLSYTNVDNSQGFWGVTVAGYGAGTTTITKLSSSAGSSIADTGTTLIYLPASVLKAYYAKVSGSQNSNTYGGYVFPCSATLPDLYLKIGSYTARVPGKYINYAPANNAGTTCFGGLQDSAGIGLNILGDVFLKSQYVVFDNSATPRLGLAQQSS